MSKVFVDVETGTVLNGPVVQVPEEVIPEDGSDSEIIEAATEWVRMHGTPKN